MIFLSQLTSLIKKIEEQFQNGFFQSNKEVVFVCCLIGFPVLARITPLYFVTLLFVICFLIYIINHFYIYVNQVAESENKNVNIAEYSWGFVKNETSDGLDLKNLTNYLKTKKIDFYRQYLCVNKNNIIFIAFLLGDLLVAFKNLSFDVSGAYFTLSLFTKFVFLAYIYTNKENQQIIQEQISVGEKEYKILDNFYRHFSGIASVGFVLFVIFYLISRPLIDVFFGIKYLEYQTSLAFILLANIALLLGLIVFKTSTTVDNVRTWKFTKIFALIFGILFVFVNINYPDTVAFFVIGATAVFSIFLYNFCIRKPSYIENTYNYLF